jgi:Transposase, Mutator family
LAISRESCFCRHLIASQRMASLGGSLPYSGADATTAVDRLSAGRRGQRRLRAAGAEAVQCECCSGRPVEQPGAASVRAQHHQVVTALEPKFPQAAAHLYDSREDILAFTAFPREIWRQVWSNNPRERLNKEIRRRNRSSSFVGVPVIALSSRASSPAPS